MYYLNLNMSDNWEKESYQWLIIRIGFKAHINKRKWNFYTEVITFIFNSKTEKGCTKVIIMENITFDFLAFLIPVHLLQQEDLNIDVFIAKC